MNVKDQISQGESETIEFKKSAGEWKEAIETISAFANAVGGRIIIGVLQTGKLLGVEIGKGTIEDLTNKISQNIDPKIRPRVTMEKMDGKSLIMIEVKESSDHLVLAFGRPYKRVGRSTVQMSKDEYERSILEKHKDKLYFDEQICKEVTLTDIDGEKVKGFVKEAKKQRGLDIDEDLSIGEMLERLKLVKNRKITNAAVLLFGKDPQNVFMQAIVKAIRFKGADVTGEMIDFKTIEGDILSQLERAEDFIFEHIPKRAWLEDGKLQRQEKWLYPPKAIREVLANALAHRDYKSTSNVQIRIFDDRLEIWNPGCLPAGLTVEKLKTSHGSVPQNPLVARAFFWVKYVEEVGTGTNKMIKWCKEWELPEPKFEDMGASFVVVFRSDHIDESVLEKLNERQKKAVDYTLKNKKITNKEYSSINNVSRVYAFQELSDLVKKGIFKQVGKGRGSCYIVSD